MKLGAVMAAASYLLIRQARILEAGGDFLLGDVLVGEEKILQIAPDIQTSGDDSDWEVIDADGLTLLPGVIDPQVHFREPGLEHKEDLFTATSACAAGWRGYLVPRNAQHSTSDDYPGGSRRQAAAGCGKVFS